MTPRRYVSPYALCTLQKLTCIPGWHAQSPRPDTQAPLELTDGLRPLADVPHQLHDVDPDQPGQRLPDAQPAQSRFRHLPDQPLDNPSIRALLGPAAVLDKSVGVDQQPHGHRAVLLVLVLASPTRFGAASRQRESLVVVHRDHPHDRIPIHPLHHGQSRVAQLGLRANSHNWQRHVQYDLPGQLRRCVANLS